MTFSFRTSAIRRVSLCARAMGRGMSSGVSLQAKPTIIPWSPAPTDSRSSPAGSVSSRTSSDTSTPWAMSWDCSSMDTLTPQDW